MDSFTLHLSSALTNLTCFAILATAFAMGRDGRSFAWWAAAFLVFAAGLLLQVGWQAPVLFDAVTYGLLVAGALLLKAGFRSFDAKPGFSLVMLACLPLPPAVFLGLFMLLPGTQWPQVATFGVSCLIAAQTPFYILHHDRQRLVFRRMAGITLVGQFAVTVVVALWTPALMSPENLAIAISLTDQVCTTVVIACVLGMGMERDNLRLSRLVHRDALTGCMNRGGFLVYEAEASGPAGVLAIDLDHFKALNDRHGHAAGDEALREFARRATATLPERTVLARTGGEEFVAVLPGLGEDEALRIAGHLAEALRTAPLDWHGTPIRFTASIGVSAASLGEGLSKSMERADTALYRAKALGRDRAVLFEGARDDARAPLEGRPTRARRVG